jgi:hypothetical protein
VCGQQVGAGGCLTSTAGMPSSPLRERSSPLGGHAATSVGIPQHRAACWDAAPSYTHHDGCPP